MSCSSFQQVLLHNLSKVQHVSIAWWSWGEIFEIAAASCGGDAIEPAPFEVVAITEEARPQKCVL